MINHSVLFFGYRANIIKIFFIKKYFVEISKKSFGCGFLGAPREEIWILENF